MKVCIIIDASAKKTYYVNMYGNYCLVARVSRAKGEEHGTSNKVIVTGHDRAHREYDMHIAYFSTMR